MSYYIVQTKPLRRIFRLASFPYCAYEGDPERYPFVRLLGVADTLRGARRLIAKDKAKRSSPGFPETVVERVA